MRFASVCELLDALATGEPAAIEAFGTRYAAHLLSEVGEICKPHPVKQNEFWKRQIVDWCRRMVCRKAPAFRALIAEVTDERAQWVQFGSWLDELLQAGLDASVADLFAHLAAHDPDAYDDFEDRFKDSIESVIRDGRTVHNIPSSLADLISVGLSRVRITILSCTQQILDELPPDPRQWIVLGQWIVVHVQKWLFLEGHRPRPDWLPTRTPERQRWAIGGFDIGAAAWPHSEVSGDMFDVVARDGQPWILLMDGTGHSWLPYLIVQGVKDFWRKLLDSDGIAEPYELLNRLQTEMAPALPDGIFVEGVAAVLRPEGSVVAATSGGRVVRKLASQPLELEELPGFLLGNFDWGELDREVYAWRLADQDELCFVTDGFVDQLGASDINGLLATEFPQGNSEFELHEGICALIERVLKDGKQFDDITLVSARLSGARSPAANEPNPQGAGSQTMLETESVAAPQDTRNSNCEQCLPFDCEQAVRDCGQQDAAACNNVVKQVLPQVERRVRAVLRLERSADWDDATQMALMKVYRRMSTWRAECPFCKWAEVVAVRTAISAASTPMSLPLLQDAPETAGSTVDRLALRECMESKFQQFKPEWRELLQLWQHEGKTHEQIAEHFGKTRKTIALWLNAIREQLSECLEE